MQHFLNWLSRWRKKAKQLKQDTYALYLARKDPRIPWYAKVLAICILAYAFSPIDLIPDFIPVLGYLDDLVLVPLALVLVLKMIPSQVLNEYRSRALTNRKRPTSWIAAGLIVVLWLIGIALAFRLVVQLVSK